eukprot:jgi/Psemu1/8077/gm1.8077_g
MPDFCKMSSMTSDSVTRKKKKEKLLSPLDPIPRQIDMMVNLFLFETGNGVAGKLAVVGRTQITNQFNNYEMKIGNTKPHLYGRYVVNYKTIKKYMVVYRKILVWYMENVKYPPPT